MHAKESANEMTSGWFKKALTRLAPGTREAPPPLGRAALAAEIRSVKQFMIAGELAQARTRLDTLFDSNPDDPDVLAHLGACIYLSGAQSDATAFLAKAYGADPNNAFAARFFAACVAAQSASDEAMAVARQAVALNPTDTEVLSVAASLATRRGEFDDAANYLNRALEIQPDALKPLEQIEALSVVSTFKRSLYEKSPKIAEARRRATNRLVALHRKKPLAPEELASLLALLEGSAESFPTALKIAANEARDKDSLTPPLALQLASILWLAGNGKEMLRYRTIALELEPTNRNTALGLSHAQLMQDAAFWPSAWQTMTDVLFHSRPDLHPAGATLWTGQRLGKEPLLIYQDQGIGDAIVGLRFLAALRKRGIRYRLWVLPALADLAARLEGGDVLIRQDRLPSAAESGCPFACPLFGLISALKLPLSEIGQAPVLAQPIGHAAALSETIRALVPRPRLGLVVGGNPMRRDDWLRSLSPEATAPLAQIKGVSWVNLMIDERPLRGHLVESLGMLDPMGDVRSFADTAALIGELDAVIAVDSSVAHLALALGKKVWVLAPSMLDWRWQIGATLSPFWPNATVLRADGPGIWTKAVKRLVEEIGVYRDASMPST